MAYDFVYENAPIALFVYNRFQHTQLTVNSLMENDLAKESHLYVFSDGAKSVADKNNVLEVRKYIKNITGFKSLSVIEREKNLGLAQSIVSGVSEIVNRYGRVVVLEDDMVTSPYFLRFMNEALELYKDEDRVISIHGYCYPVNVEMPETFFIRGSDCWGWATWKRGWVLFEPDGRKLLAEVTEKKLKNEFNLFGAYQYTQMLKDQIRGKNNSWAVRWHASAFLRGKLTLYPGRSLVKNIGLDASGYHCGKTNYYEVNLVECPISIKAIPIEENDYAARQIQDYLRNLRPSVWSLIKRTFEEYNNKLHKRSH